MSSVPRRKGKSRGGGKSVAKTAKRLSPTQRNEATKILSDWNRVRRAREHHELSVPRLEASRKSVHSESVRLQVERDLRRARAWVDGIDSAILLYAKEGPARVFQEAREYAYSAAVVFDYEYVLQVCKRAKQNKFAFRDLPETDRLRLAAMTGIPLVPGETEAEWEQTWKKAEGRAQRIFDSQEVQKKLYSDGPSRAADELLAQTKDTNASRIRRLRRER
jgi:hypothetical protein